jgi:hypothetical protein
MPDLFMYQSRAVVKPENSRKTMSSKIDFGPGCSDSPECFTMAERDFELAAEIESHLQMRNDDHLRSNLTYDETRRAAC